MKKVKAIVREGGDGFDGFNVYDMMIGNLIERVPYDKSLPVDEQEDAVLDQIREDYEIVELSF